MSKKRKKPAAPRPTRSVDRMYAKVRDAVMRLGPPGEVVPYLVDIIALQAACKAASNGWMTEEAFIAGSFQVLRPIFSRCYQAYVRASVRAPWSGTKGEA